MSSYQFIKSSLNQYIIMPFQDCFGFRNGKNSREDPREDCWNADTDIPLVIVEPNDKIASELPELSTLPNDDSLLFHDDNGDDREELEDYKKDTKIQIEEEEDKESAQRLSNIWKVWYYHRNNRQEAVHWMANQKVIFQLETVGDVFKMVRGVVPLEDLDINQDIAIFKDNIEPWYEDPANEFGGQWTVAVKKDREYSEKLERVWAAMMSFCLLPDSPYREIINGFSFAIRGSVYSRCYVWLKNCDEVDLILEIGARIAAIAKLDDPFLFTNNQTKKVMFSL